MKVGKIQVMPIFVGAGFPQALHDCYIPGDARIEIVVTPALKHAIAVDRAYKHLGSIKDAKRNATAEINVRKGEARSAQKQLSKAFKKTCIPPFRVWLFTQSLCISRLLFDVHTFAKLTASQCQSLQGCYQLFARRACSHILLTKTNALLVKSLLLIAVLYRLIATWLTCA